MKATEPIFNVRAVLPVSYANGPGKRFVIWTQGCRLGCPGCFNPETHSEEPYELITVNELFDRVVNRVSEIEGVTMTGGEPFLQYPALTAFLRRIRRETSLSVVVFTGYGLEEIRRRFPDFNPPEYIDLLIDGPYRSQQRLDTGLRASENQRLHFLTDRYTVADVETVAEREIIIDPDGTIHLTGIHP